MSGAIRARRATLAEAPRAMDATLALRQLLNPIRRHTITGVSRNLVIAGVWPDGRGFSARLDSPRRPGVPVSWARWRDGLEVWPFPDDPSLTALPRMIGLGYRPVGHRLGRRATLGASDGTHLLHLRPARSALATFQSWIAVHEALLEADVPIAALGPKDPKIPALRSEWVMNDDSFDGPSAEWMRALGESMARAHAATPPPGLPARGAGPALDAAVRQITMAVHSGTAFTQWLERRLERWGLLSAARGHWHALVHGDLNLAHVASRGTPILLDWERAGLGDAEEDLGSLAADLYWRLEPGTAAAQFAAFREGHRARHGDTHQALFEYYARLTLVRTLAVKSMSEPAQTHLRARQSDWSAWPEIVSSW